MSSSLSRRAAVFAIASMAAGLAVDCRCPKTPAGGAAHDASTEAASEADPASAARREFEIIDARHAVGTRKMYSRGDFLPLDDENALSEGDFIGRLRTLFGAVANDEYVFRHVATGFIVTAYTRQSGPSFGGGSRYRADVAADASPLDFALSVEEEPGAQARIAADPILAGGPAVDWSKVDLKTLPPAELRALREKEHAWFRRLHDASAPPGFAEVVARLNGLLDAVRPADWEVTRYWGDDPSVYRVGAKGGVAFHDELAPADGLDLLLTLAETDAASLVDSASGTSGADERIVEYFVYHAKRGALSDDALPRVQAAWYRHVARIGGRTDREMRARLLDSARARIAPLKIERAKGEVAIAKAR